MCVTMANQISQRVNTVTISRAIFKTVAYLNPSNLGQCRCSFWIAKSVCLFSIRTAPEAHDTGEEENWGFSLQPDTHNISQEDVKASQACEYVYPSICGLFPSFSLALTRLPVQGIPFILNSIVLQELQF